MTQPADLKNLTDSEGPEQSRVHGAEQNDDPCQPRSGHCQDDNHVAQRATALVRPESMQETNCPPHIQSPACRCRMTTRSRILWPIRPAPESESRIGPINRALTRARCELSAVFLADKRNSYLDLLTGARCQLPTGELVEVVHRKTPFYDLCRELDRLGNRRPLLFAILGAASAR